MDSVSTVVGTAGGPGGPVRASKRLWARFAVAFLAIGVAGAVLVTSGGNASADHPVPDCPPGTFLFYAHVPVPGATPGTFETLPISACVSQPPPPTAGPGSPGGPGGTPLAGGSVFEFVTPTPGTPVTGLPTQAPVVQTVVVVVTATPPAGATTGGLPTTGIRPPSTGDGGLSQAGSGSSAFLAIFALGGGLAIGTGARAVSGRGRGRLV